MYNPVEREGSKPLPLSPILIYSSSFLFFLIPTLIYFGHLSYFNVVEKSRITYSQFDFQTKF